MDIEFDGWTVPEDVVLCYLDALAGQTFPCLAELEVPYWQECFTALA